MFLACIGDIRPWSPVGLVGSVGRSVRIASAFLGKDDREIGYLHMPLGYFKGSLKKTQHAMMDG